MARERPDDVLSQPHDLSGEGETGQVLSYLGTLVDISARVEAEAFQLGLEALWRSPQAGALLAGVPRARIVDIVETKLY